MPPRLSVVVPFYGVEDYIGECLESIRQQSLRDIEVVLVDDGSLDGSVDVAKQYVERDDRFTLVRQQNQGLGPARNTGAAAATGEFLTFVDSDDLVARRGFETLVEMLDSSGSSIAAGNAHRFTRSSGAWQSWTHQQPFSITRLATHITEIPVLSRDRMVWNKVYRRSFWDEYGYAFPAIRYEDYPVTLPAHIQALTVDTLAMPVYYWRERESGNSITQQAYRFDNLLDRVISAEMVLDDIDRLLGRDFPRVREEVVHALAQTDMLTIYQAFASVPDADVDRLLTLGHRFSERLRDAAPGRRHVYDQIQAQALRAQDVDLLRDLAHFRADGGLRGWARGTKAPHIPWRLEYPYPGIGRRAISRKLFAVPHKEQVLRTSVRRVFWQDGDLHLVGTAEIRHHRSDETASIGLALQSEGSRTRIPVRMFPTRDSHGDTTNVGFEATVPRTTLLDAAERGPLASFKADVRLGTHHKKGPLRGALPGSSTWPDGEWLTDSTWAQPTTTSAGSYVVSFLTDQPRLTHCEATDDLVRFEISANVDDDDVFLTIGATQHIPELRSAPVTRSGSLMVFEMALDDLFIGDLHDDPVNQSRTRSVHLESGDTPALILWDTDKSTIRIARNGRVMRLTRSPGARVSLVEGPAQLVMDRLELVGSGDELELVVSGPEPSEPLPDDRVAWRRYLPGGDEHVDADVSRAAAPVPGGGRWSVATKVADLLNVPVAQHSGGMDRMATIADWSLFVGQERSREASVTVDPFAYGDMPLLFEAGRQRAVVRPRGGIPHVHVYADL